MHRFLMRAEIFDVRAAIRQSGSEAFLPSSRVLLRENWLVSRAKVSRFFGFVSDGILRGICKELHTTTIIVRGDEVGERGENISNSKFRGNSILCNSTFQLNSPKPICKSKMNTFRKRLVTGTWKLYFSLISNKNRMFHVLSSISFCSLANC